MRWWQNARPRPQVWRVEQEEVLRCKPLGRATRSYGEDAQGFKVPRSDLSTPWPAIKLSGLESVVHGGLKIEQQLV